MDLKLWTSLLIIALAIFKSFAQDVSQKSSSKVSDFKAKLAKIELTSKSPESVKNFDDNPEVVSDLGISVPPEYANDTVKRDHHTYYNSTFYSDPVDARRFWINLEDLPESHVVMHEKLSDSYRQATTVELSFDFPFYGSLLRNVTIATGGFLYMGDYLHNWIAATQYIAPLMANFDTRLSTDSVIKYADNGTAFTVQWEKVYIQNRDSEGAFTFQVTLLKNGDIIFAYKDVPYPVSSISDSQHPVKVGLSDAYILERAIFFVRRKTVYEYNRIHITNWDISNNTALYFTALPTCNTFKDCSSCISSGSKMECNWCEAVKRCSDGIDRQRQSWVENGCTINKVAICTENVTSTGNIDINTYKVTDMSFSTKQSISKGDLSTHNTDIDINSNNVFNSNDAASHVMHEDSEEKTTVNAKAIATILVCLAIIMGVLVWIYYAYKNPQSSSGQFLIKYRPSQWVVRKESTVVTSNSQHF